MKFEHIVCTLVLSLVLFSSMGAATVKETSRKDIANKIPYYDDPDYVWSSTGWGSSKVFLNMDVENDTIFENDVSDLEGKTLTPSEIKAAKERYIDKIMEMDEFKDYSRKELEKTIVPFSEFSSSLIDAENTYDIIKCTSTSVDIVSFKEGNIIKMKTPAIDRVQESTSSKELNDVTTATVPNVVITNINCDWSWVQNENALNTITVHNYGTVTAEKGAIAIVSLDENKGYVWLYENLAAGQDGTVTIPFYVDVANFPTVGAKPISIRAYVKEGDYFYLTSAPTISLPMVEMYNNGPEEIEDPDNGLSLQTDDVSHHDEYEIARRAAIAGDQTISPYNTAATVSSYVNQLMTYDVDYFYIQSTHTASDEFIIGNGFHGVCDEYAVMNGAYLRALGVPTRRIAINGILDNSVLAHQFNEFWDGNRWVHTDAQANVFDNPRSYVNSGMLVTEVGRVHSADDTKSNVDDSPVFTEGLLHTVYDMAYDYPAGVIAIYS
ncbi:MAG: transglutaminase-like domain-containing protein [Methanolobus sp.]|nr:transglutaminase-like domain-containing protein [Methanolobus sp.]